MDELKKSLKALDPQVRLIIWCALAIVTWLLFCFLDVTEGAKGFDCLTEASDLPYGSIFLIVSSLGMIILPFIGIVTTIIKKKIVALPAYLCVGTALFIMMFFDFKMVAGIYWLTFVMSIAWAFFGFILNGEKADFDSKIPQAPINDDSTRII